MPKYKHYYTTSRPWPEIQKHYQALVIHGLAYQPFLELIQHIVESKLADRLYAYTSMHKLVIGIYDRIEWDSEALHIEFDIDSSKWHFRYYPKPNRNIEYERTFAKEKGIEQFNNFLQKLKW